MSSLDDLRIGLLAAAAVAVLPLTGCAPDTSAQTQGAAALSAPVSASPTPAPTPSATPTATPSTAAPSASASRAAGAGPSVMAASEPVSVSIPAIGAASELLRLGLRDNGSLEVPPGEPGSPASWYTGSPTPGQRGPAVLLGHVNATDGGLGVFANLRSLKPGDTIEVAREDGSTVVFAVVRGEQYAKDDFPTLAVYGNTEGAELRLITCDGYDAATGQFDDNYVVYAELVA